MKTKNLILFSLFFLNVAISDSQSLTLYGMTFSGGESNAGTIFQMNTSGSSFSSDFSFPVSQSVGSYPNNKLIQANNDLLYGMTAYGGTGGLGTMFLYDISTLGTVITIHNFDGNSDGAT